MDKETLPDLNITLSTIAYQTPSTRITLPTISDPDPSDTWTVSVDNLASTGLYQFTTLAYPYLTFSPMEKKHAGKY